ncbi:MAG: 50S ribosomal protein L11 methyltransferase [Desulfotomaculaceae bacterium]|nr:50S ribosomal protein L11 methyltransferase [Desulfotomaculaceae bacterium]
MNWLEVAVQVPPEGVELVADIFQDIGTGGVVIEDPAVILRYAAATDPDEWGVEAPPPGERRPVIKGYLAADAGLARRLEQLKAALNNLELSPVPELSTCKVAEEDWANCWKSYYKPIRVGKHLVVKPSWEDYPVAAGDLVIEMDPGMAFGCGTHATTALCLKLLEKYVSGGETVYDIGTGTGILTIASALLGAGRVVAVDHDPVACRTAMSNVKRNGVAGRVQVMQGDLLSSIDDKADLIVANIIASVITHLAVDVSKTLSPCGRFIASGIISERGPEVIAALESAGLSVMEQLEDGGWVAFVCCHLEDDAIVTNLNTLDGA